MADVPVLDPVTRRAGRDALVAFVLVAIGVAGLVQLNVEVPFVGHLGSALIAVLFLYTPSWFAARRGEYLEDYGFVTAPLARNLATAGVVMVVIFPLFALGYLAFYYVACDTQALTTLVPPGMCRLYQASGGLQWPAVDLAFLSWCLVQLVVVALPEELFFRGFLLRLLERRFPPARRWLGGHVGLALLLSSAAFALVHLPKDGDPRALATFFPGLVFGWMRSRTDSILAPTLVHAGSNILVRLLDASLLR